MIAPKKLSDYPWVVVRVECKLCPRKGLYRLARLAARYGPELPLDRLLSELAHDCPWWRDNPRKYDPRCGARFIDIDRNLPPPDEPLHRRRGPDREDIASRRSFEHLRLSSAVPMLSGAAPVVKLACDGCGLREQWITAELLKLHGDLKMPDMLPKLTATCPKRSVVWTLDRCRVRFALPEDDRG